MEYLLLNLVAEIGGVPGEGSEAGSQQLAGFEGEEGGSDTGPQQLGRFGVFVFPQEPVEVNSHTRILAPGWFAIVYAG